MPHVASDPKTHALKHPLPHSPRPPQASDRAQATPFESLLDDSAPAPAEKPAQASADDKATRADRSEPAKPAAKADDGKAAKPGDNAKPTEAAKSADADKPAQTDPSTDDSKAAGEDKAAADAKAAELAAAGDAAKPASDGKPTSDGKTADGVTPVAAAPAADPIQTITTADAIATALAPASAPEPSVAPQAATASATKAVTNAVTNAAIAAAPVAKPDTPTALQADAGKSADDSKLAIKTAAPSQTDAKPQAATGDADADKDSTAHVGGDVPANSHRGATVEAPGPVATDTNAATPKATADATQPAPLTVPAHTTAASAANPAAAAPAPAPAPQAAAIPLAGVAIEIAGKALAGKNRFEIRLDPPELGRIEVRLDVDRDGNVTSRLIADRSDTLDLLRRDAAGLERALQDAGLKTADNSMQFSLRDQTMGRDQGNTATPGAVQIVVDDDALAAADLNQRGYSRLAGQGSGIDIHV